MRQMLERLLLCALCCALALGLCPAARAEAEGEDEVDLLAVDHRLYELGYRDGACSGVLDDVMVNALRNFQTANGLGVTGEPDAGTVFVLLSDSARSQEDYLSRMAGEYEAMPELRAGAYGQEVMRLQYALQELGYFQGKCDGNLGDDSVEAICRFQLANGLEVTGSADGAVFARLYNASPDTWQEFLRSCTAAVGDSGDKVRLLQRWLSRKGYFEGAYTAQYGEETQRAVRRFQADAGLEASGSADQATCEALFGDVTGLLEDAAVMRRGMLGAQELCAGLQALGYDAHDGFDMQTELALMQFQRANGMEVTGEADAALLERLRAPDAVGRAGCVASGAQAVLAEDFGAQLAGCATRLLGEVSGFEEEFGLVQYVYLRCGVLVLGRGQFASAGEELADARPGDVMVLTLESGERTGVVAADGGLVYRDASSRIVLGYPRLMAATAVQLYRLQ